MQFMSFDSFLEEIFISDLIHLWKFTSVVYVIFEDLLYAYLQVKELSMQMVKQNLHIHQHVANIK